MTTRLLTLCVVAVALLVTACTQASPSETSVPSLAPGATAIATSGPASTDTGQEPATPDVAAPNASPGTADIEWDYGDGTFDFTEPAAGLSDLDSYRSTLAVSFAGTDAGQPAAWSNTYEMIATGDNAGRQLTVTPTGDQGDASAESVYRAETNGVAYERQGTAPCTSGSIYQPDSLELRWEPAAFLPGVSAAVEAGTETIEGVPATHYTFDERAFGSLPESDSTGEMWVATDGGYIVKYMVTTVGDADYFGEGSDGTLTYDYNVTDINGQAEIELPADCPQGAIDAPLLADATDVVRVPGLISYTTSSAPEGVVGFYQEAMPVLGWEATNDPTVSETDTFVNFTRDDEQLSVIVTTDGATSTVRLVASPVQH